MNRSLTNAIRFVMDEFVPPVIRDSKWFMYPFYFLAYRGRNIKKAMNFKKEVYHYTPDQYEEFYTNLNSTSRNRRTDINQPSLKFILENIPSDTKNVLDVGCGNGYLLNRINKTFPAADLTGVDIKRPSGDLPFKFINANIDSLPFPDKSFDVVTCCHTIEHIINPRRAVEELKRITGKMLIIAVPCQRYFFHTLDEHVNFFPYREALTSLINIEKFTCKKIHGDWVYIGYIRE
jgi:SAM-dependent methyltransferase